MKNSISHLSKLRLIIFENAYKITISMFLAYFLTCLSSNVFAQDSDEINQVKHAYELRTNGDFDEAKLVLNNLLNTNPDFGMANYEMARLISHANPTKTDEALNFVDLAIESDPENPSYRFYRARKLFLKSYIEIRRGDKNKVKEIVETACSEFKKVVAAEPECLEALTYLVDIYKNMSEEYGGNIDSAKYYAQELEKLDPYFHALASLIINQENEIDFWTEYLDQNKSDSKARISLVKAFLMEGDIPKAKKYAEELSQQDIGYSIRYLHVGRAHIMRVMMGKSTLEEEGENIIECFLTYLKSENNSPNIQAWCYGQLSRLENRLGNTEKSKNYLNKGLNLDPYFSRAFAIPEKEVPPFNNGYIYTSFFKPF
jgi:tetratricopeptide (TPR) repeat protein